MQHEALQPQVKVVNIEPMIEAKVAEVWPTLTTNSIADAADSLLAISQHATAATQLGINAGLQKHDKHLTQAIVIGMASHVLQRMICELLIQQPDFRSPASIEMHRARAYDVVISRIRKEAEQSRAEASKVAETMRNAFAVARAQFEAQQETKQ